MATNPKKNNQGVNIRKIKKLNANEPGITAPRGSSNRGLSVSQKTNPLDKEESSGIEAETLPSGSNITRGQQSLRPSARMTTVHGTSVRADSQVASISKDKVKITAPTPQKVSSVVRPPNAQTRPVSTAKRVNVPHGGVSPGPASVIQRGQLKKPTRTPVERADPERGVRPSLHSGPSKLVPLNQASGGRGNTTATRLSARRPLTVTPKDPVVSPRRGVHPSAQLRGTKAASISGGSSNTDKRRAGIDASVHVFTQGTTYNIGGSATVQFLYGSQVQVNQPFERGLHDKIRNMKRSYNAEYDMTIHSTRGPCTPDTRVKILQNLVEWCNSPKVPLYWLNGMAGTGKTTISFTVSEMLKDANLLGASFFCSRALPDCRDVNLIFSTIAFQLAQKYSHFGEELFIVLQGDPDIHRRRLDNQLRKLILDPWRKRSAELPEHVVVVLDALDECQDGHSEFLRVLFANVVNLPFKVLVTSRPELSIRDAMMDKDIETRSTFVLHEVEKDLVHADIVKYLRSVLSPRISSPIIETIAELSGSLFVYAATLARLFETGKVSVSKYIEALKSSSSNRAKTQAMIALDELYRVVLAGAFSSMPLEEDTRDIKDVLFTVVCACEPLTQGSLAGLWRVEEEEVSRRLDLLRSVLFVSDDHEHPITTFHASFSEFLLDPSRSKEFYCNPGAFHIKIAERCLVAMTSSLHRNLCKVDGRISNSSIDPDVIGSSINPYVRYATIYWVEHWTLSDPSERKTVLDSIREFVMVHVLHWIECLSLLGKLHVAVQSLGSLEDQLDEDSDLVITVHETLRLIQHVYDLVEYSAMEIYLSAFTWIPTNSLLRTQRASLCRSGVQVLSGLPAQWRGPERMIKIHSKDVSSIAISADGNLIVSGSQDKTVRIWNVRTQTEDSVLSDHTEPVRSIAISQDAKRFLSGSFDKTIRVWNVATQETVLTLNASDRVWAVALSQDGKWIASGQFDRLVCVWDATGGQLVHSLRGHNKPVQAVLFLPLNTRRLLVSASNDHSARIWNVLTGELNSILAGHSDSVTSLACSATGDLIITGSNDKTARVWSVSGKELLVLRGHADRIGAVGFMPNGRRAVTGSLDDTLRIWDVLSGDAVHLFKGVGLVKSIAIFPDGRRIAASSGSGIVIWSVKGIVPAGETEALPDLSLPMIETHAIALSLDGRRVLLLPSMRILDTENQKEITKLTPGINKKACGTWSLSGSRIAGTPEDEKLIQVWELKGHVVAGNHLTLIGHTDSINGVSFSHDERLLVSASEDWTARIWDLATSQQIHTLDHAARMQSSVYSAVFSHDNFTIASVMPSSINLWSTVSGEHLSKFDTGVYSANFTPDDQNIIASHKYGTTVLDRRTGGEEYQHPGFRFWTTFQDGMSWALSNDGWVCRFARIGGEPCKLFWIPSQYRPNLGVNIFYPNQSNGPLFTSSPKGIQLCLPRADGFMTLVIPYDYPPFFLASGV